MENPGLTRRAFEELALQKKVSKRQQARDYCTNGIKGGYVVDQKGLRYVGPGSQRELIEDGDEPEAEAA